MWPFTAYPEKSAQDVAEKEFDYVVIGGGTAGCVVASRLSEDKTCNVLLLEKGEVNDALLTKIPLASQGPHANDQRVTRETQKIPSIGDRSIEVYTSESLGGASRLNGMLWTRGMPACYNEWAELGCLDWSWEKVEPYFIKAENARHQPKAHHRGHRGPIQLTQSPNNFAAQPYFDSIASSLGLTREHDANCPTGPAMGYFNLDFAIMENGNRGSSYTAYLPKRVALSRQSSLTVCTRTVATKLELDIGARKATGVHIRCGKTKRNFFVKVRRDVVLTSGAIKTPHLLMLSGIGPSSQLKSHGINVKRHLSGVGTQLSDHHACPVTLEVPLSQSYHRLVADGFFALWQLLLYLLWGSGWLRVSNTPNCIFMSSASIDEDDLTVKPIPGAPEFDSTKPENNPDIEMSFFANTAKVYQPVGQQTFYAVLIRPQTAGRLELVSPNPEDDLKIYYNMLQDPHDRSVMRKALRFALKFADLFLSSSYPYKVKLFLAPNAKDGKSWRNITDDELDLYLNTNANSSLHLSSTCRMGDEANGGVVDEQLRVHGFSNIRIADASIFPKVPSCHTMAPVVMVGERCADFLKQAQQLNA